MADDIPSGDRAVFAVFELFALAFAFEGAARLLDGKYAVGLLAVAVSIFFFIAGLKWPYIKLKTGSRFAFAIDRLANDSRYRLAAILLVGFYIGISSLLYVHSLRRDLDWYVMPRSISEKQADDLREYLSHREAHAVTVKVNSLDQEATEYAGQIFNALKKTDWDVTFSTYEGAPFTLNNGLCLNVEGENASPPDPKHNPLLLLQEGLQASNIVVNCSGGSGAGEYKVFVLVGHRPTVVGDRVPTLSKFGRWIMHLAQ